MFEAAKDLEALTAALAQEAMAEDVGEHLETQEILDYHAGDLEEAAEQRLQDHLVSCRRCAARVLDFDSLAVGDHLPVEGVADFEVLASWRELWGRIKAQRRTAWFSSPRFAAAVAAACLAALLGLSGANLRLRQSVTKLTAHQANPALVRLDPLTYRSEQVIAEVELPAESEYFILQVTLEDRSSEEYELEVVGPDSEEFLKIGGIKDDKGLLRALLHRGDFRAGEYSIHVYGRNGEERRSQREYRLRIRDSEGGAPERQSR